MNHHHNDRKSASLALPTRKRLISSLCHAVCTMSNTLSTSTMTAKRNESNAIVPQSFRDAFACHLYMLYTFMVFTESEIKAMKALGNNGSGSGGGGGAGGGRKGSSNNNKREKERKMEAEQIQKMREACVMAMLAATKAMAENMSTLWKRGVPDESVVGLPCRISYLMLENATGVIARKLASGDAALKMIAMTIDSVDAMVNTIVAALVDLLHSFDHVAKLVSELCCIISKDSENKLTVELLREIGRLDVSITSTSSEVGGKASGIRNIAPLINELAEKKPKLVLENIGLVLPHLQSEPYNLRSAIVTAIGHILINSMENENEEDNDAHQEESEFETPTTPRKKQKSIAEQKSLLFDILIERTRDVSSYTRVAVLKTWANLIESQTLPLNRLIPVTELAIDRLQDKTVMVRRSAMQVS